MGHPGARVQLVALQRRADLNGRHGACKRWLSSEDRWEVVLDNGDKFYALPQNIIRAEGKMHEGNMHEGNMYQGKRNAAAKKKCQAKCVKAEAAMQGSSPGQTRGPGSQSGSQEIQRTPGSEEEKTTVMFRNLPNNYTRDELLTLIEKEGYLASVNFLYLRIDFKKNTNVGYAFLNMISNAEAVKFRDHFTGFDKWVKDSDKKAVVSWGDSWQGLAAQIERYRNSEVMHPSSPDEWRPILLENGEEKEFPLPTKRLRAPRIPQARIGHPAGKRSSYV